VDAQVIGWQDAVRGDPEIGGDKLDASVAAAKSVVERFGTPELREVIDGAALDHPELLRL
jgi:hypothetical protein